jgi:hypothetical protein
MKLFEVIHDVTLPKSECADRYSEASGTRN